MRYPISNESIEPWRFAIACLKCEWGCRWRRTGWARSPGIRGSSPAASQRDADWSFLLSSISSVSALMPVAAKWFS